MSLGCSNAISELGRQLDESINILYSLIANELSI